MDTLVNDLKVVLNFLRAPYFVQYYLLSFLVIFLLIQPSQTYIFVTVSLDIRQMNPNMLRTITYREAVAT